MSRARAHAPELYERLLRSVEWKLAEMPLPRLQRIGASEDRFLYEISWTDEIRAREFRSPSFDWRIRFVGRSAQQLVQLAELVRPLVQRKWASLVARLNSDVIEDSRLEEFLFGASRTSLEPVRRPLAEFQEGRCFYCEEKLGRKPVAVDHFIPWSRHADNGLENLVLADGRCNSAKSDYLAAGPHVARWRAARFGADYEPLESLRDLAADLSWEHHPERTLSVARALYGRIAPDSMLWLRRKRRPAGDRSGNERIGRPSEGAELLP